MTPSRGMVRERNRASMWMRFLGLATIVAFLGAAWAGPCQAYTPESREVRAVLARALAYLETAPKIGESDMLGGRALLGLAAYKYYRRFGGDSGSLPKLTQEGLARVLKDAGNLHAENNYSVGLALILLSEVQPEQHTEAASAYLAELLRRQKPHGGWGYPNMDSGDLSQLQYAVLGLWAAHHMGLDAPRQSMANVVEYVIRVQDPSGGWGYQGVDPGGYTRVPQMQIRHSLCAAGLGSLYVGADLLGMSRSGKPRTISGKNLPPALVPILEPVETPRAGGRNVGVNIERLTAAMNDGQQWFRNNGSTQTQTYQYYFLYGLERYHSFREKYEGKFEEEPQWYIDGFRLLRDLQSDAGSWGTALMNVTTPTGTSPPISTAFAMLFLLRSTQETIEKVVERDGILRGGHGLPSDLSEVRVRDHQLVAPAITGEVADLIAMLEDDKGDKIENLLENPDALSLSGLKDEGRQFTARLVRILRGGQSYQARIVAARTLGRQGELDNVPILIYALTDPDPRVVREAHDALRLISRKFDGLELPEKPDGGQLDSVIGRWKAWYRSVRPDAVFLD